jgi:DNA-directed RNA polymerase subunit RPC12/RpoP
MPAALDGEQYELWEPDSQPLPSELIKREPKYIAVVCDVCGTLLQPLESQVGQRIACPDCGTKTVVQAPKKTARKSVISPDIEIPLLDLETRPAPRPGPLTPEMRARIHAEEKAAAETNVARKTDRRGRPVMPRRPLITGILSFPFSPGVPVRWVMLTIVLMGCIGIAQFSLSTIGGLSGGIESAGMGAIAGVCFLAIALVFFMMWLAGLASTIFAIITESSEGHDIIQDWPQPNLSDWFPELFYFLVAMGISGAPGGVIAHFISDNTLIAVLATVVGMLLAFPLIILSQLDGGSPISVVSVRIFQSITRCPFSWFTFYFETSCLAGICVAMGIFLPPVAVAPVAVMSLILYARLLGRLAWRLAEAMEITVA